MIRRLAPILPLALLALPVAAQNIPPADMTVVRNMLAEGQLATASLATAMQQTQKLTADVAAKDAEANKAKADLAAAEAQKATLIEWLQKAQAEHPAVLREMPAPYVGKLD